MFARTARLTLRPGWPEDAPALARAIGHESVVRMTSRIPWPYGERDAADWLAQPTGERDARLLIVAHDATREDGAPRLVGGIGLDPTADMPEIGYWLTPSAWGRGYATEAGRAVLDIARHALGFHRVAAAHALDNPASGTVLRKLGFRPAGTVVRPSLARGGDVECALLVRELSAPVSAERAAA